MVCAECDDMRLQTKEQNLRVELRVERQSKGLAEPSLHDVYEFGKAALHFLPAILKRDVILRLHRCSTLCSQPLACRPYDNAPRTGVRQST